MFRKIKIIDYNGDIVYYNRISSLPLREEKIISKSVELFNDNEPCVIHRSFVMKKLFVELEQMIIDAHGQNGNDEKWESVKAAISELAFHGTAIKHIIIE